MATLEMTAAVAVGPANSSSLLFSWTGVNSLIYLVLNGFPEGIFAFFMEGNAVHRNLFHAAVIKVVAFTQEVRSRLRVRNHRDKSVRPFHQAVQPQGAHLQPPNARRQILRSLILPAD